MRKRLHAFFMARTTPDGYSIALCRFRASRRPARPQCAEKNVVPLGRNRSVCYTQLKKCPHRVVADARSRRNRLPRVRSASERIRARRRPSIAAGCAHCARGTCTACHPASSPPGRCDADRRWAGWRLFHSRICRRGSRRVWFDSRSGRHPERRVPPGHLLGRIDSTHCLGLVGSRVRPRVQWRGRQSVAAEVSAWRAGTGVTTYVIRFSFDITRLKTAEWPWRCGPYA